MNPTVTLELTPYQARLVKAAITAEIRKGSHTFLSGRDVINLGHILDLTSLELARVESTQRWEKA